MPRRKKKIIRAENVDTAWFKKKLVERKLSQRAVGRALGIDFSSVSKLFTGERHHRGEEAKELALLLGEPLDAVLNALGVATAGVMARPRERAARTIEVVGWIDENLRVHLGKGVLGPTDVPLPDAGMEAASSVQALRYQTAGTARDALDGAVVYFAAVTGRKAGIPAELVGKLCLVWKGGGMGGKPESLLAVLKRGYRAGRFNLYGLNGQIVDEDVAVERATPVVWMKF